MLNFKSTPEPAFDCSNLEAHELANLLPMIDDANFANLKADIEKNGKLTVKGKQQAQQEAKLARKRKTVDPIITRGAVSPLGGVAKPAPQPRKRRT